MKIYIVEDDLTVINILENIIETQALGTVCGDSGGEVADVRDVLLSEPDVVLVDFFMPIKDGIEFVKELRAFNTRIKCIMISQVSSKDLIAKAYRAGIDFFISKPINIIEVTSVLQNVSRQVLNERTLDNIRTMFQNDMKNTAAPSVSSDNYEKKLKYILNRLGISGEKGCPDIIRICQYLHDNNMTVSQINMSQICVTLCDSPKNMEQRVRRAIAAGMTNIAHMGIENFMNETYSAYSSTLFAFEDVKAEMDYIRGKRQYGGKVSIKKFIDGLMLEADA